MPSSVPTPPSRPAELLRALTPERAALVRCAAGALLLTRPRTMARLLGADPSLARHGDWLARMFGVRELALGLGVLAAHPGAVGDRRRWYLAGALSDAVDAGALVAAVRSGDLGQTPLTRTATRVCTAGAVGAVAVQAAGALRAGASR